MMELVGKGKVCIRANVAHQAGAYPSFCSMNQLGVSPLPPGWDASPSQGYPPTLSSPVPIYTPGWREALWEWSVLPKNTTPCPRPGLQPRPLDPELSALTMRPPRLPHKGIYVWSRGKQLVLFSRESWCFPFVAGNIRTRGKTELTEFPRDHTLSVLLYN